MAMSAVILLVGCGTSGTSSNVLSSSPISKEEIYKAITEYKIVEMVDEDRILVDSTFYTISEHTKMSKADNQSLAFEELQPGDLVTLKDTGNIMMSYPGQGSATDVVLQNDEESLNVSESIRHFIENQETGDIISIQIKEVTADSITLHFYEWEIHGKKYEAIIDRATNAFTVNEIENEEAREQERRDKEMAEAHPEGSTAGHITEIYDDGFRVDMADYTFSETVQFTNDVGDKLSKDDFKIGSFVSVAYDRLDFDSTIGKGILSELTLLTKEENPEVRAWIQSVLEGDLYKEPVIMFSYTDHDQTYYTIRVADLKDDTPDTFEMKYDLESGQHTVVVNPG